MKLFIMRHGQAQLTAPTDKERTLTDVGQQETFIMATWLAKHQRSFDITFVSPYARALETFAITSQFIENTPQHHILEELTPDSSPEICGDTLLAYCAQINTDSALVVSHLPLVGLLVTDLCKGAMMPSFSTSSIACVELDLENWQGELLWHETYQDVLNSAI